MPWPTLTDGPGLSLTVARVSAAHCGGPCLALPIMGIFVTFPLKATLRHY